MLPDSSRGALGRRRQEPPRCATCSQSVQRRGLHTDADAGSPARAPVTGADAGRRAGRGPVRDRPEGRGRRGAGGPHPPGIRLAVVLSRHNVLEELAASDPEGKAHRGHGPEALPPAPPPLPPPRPPAPARHGRASRPGVPALLPPAPRPAACRVLAARGGIYHFSPRPHSVTLVLSGLRDLPGGAAQKPDAGLCRAAQA